MDSAAAVGIIPRVAVEFRVLGGVAAMVDGEVVEVGHARQQAVLAVLLIELNEPVRRTR